MNSYTFTFNPFTGNFDAVVGTVDAGNVTGGTPSTFAGFDNTGVLETVPGFSINTISGGMDVSLTQHPNNGSGANINNHNYNFDPLQNSPNENWNICNLGVNFDVNNSGFSQGTAGNAATLLNLSFNNQNTGPIGQTIFQNMYGGFGNGTDPLAVNGNIGAIVNLNYAANVTLNNGIQGFGFNAAVNAAAIPGTNFGVTAYSDYSNVGIPIDGYISANFTPTIAQINNNHGYSGVNVNPVVLTLVGNANVQGVSVNGTVTTMGANGGFSAYTLNPTIVTMGSNSYFHGLDINGTITTSHGNVAGVNVNPTINGGDATFQGVNISPGGTAVLNNITGIDINLSNISSPNAKVGLSINDGSINANAPYDTGVLSATPGEFQNNSLGGEFHIAAGHPMSASFGFGNNLGFTIYAEDDMAADNFLGSSSLGFSLNGFVNQVVVLSGKTMDTVNYMAAGGSTNALSTGGTIANLSMFRALGLLNGGGSLSITNMYGFKVEPSLSGLSPTNTWGIWVGDTNADNWFAKNVIIGGVTGQPISTEVVNVTGDSIFQGLLATTGNIVSGGFLDMQGNAIVNALDPVNPQDAATKNYVDTVASQLQPIQAVSAATTGSNVAGTYLNGAAGVGATFTTSSVATFTVDGYTPALGERVLLKNQTSGFQNGVYTVTQLATGILPTIFTRTLDYDTAADIDAGNLIPVINGTVNTQTSWLQTANVSTVGTDALVFVKWTANPANYLLKTNNLSDVTSASSAFNNISPVTSTGDLILGNGANSSTRLAIGSNGKVLTSNGTTASWQTPTSPTPAYNVLFKSANYTAATTDNVIVVDTSGGDVTITLPTVVGLDGHPYIITKAVAANKLFLAPAGGETIAYETAQQLTSKAAAVTLIADGVGNYIIT